MQERELPANAIEYIEALLDVIQEDLEVDIISVSACTDQYLTDKESRYWDGRLFQMKKFVLQIKNVRELLLSTFLEPDDWVCQECHYGQVLHYGNEVASCDECNGTGVYKLPQLRMEENDPWKECAPDGVGARCGSDASASGTDAGRSEG